MVQRCGLVTLWVWISVVLVVQPLQAQSRLQTNVVYGMYSGLALLMDVHYPEKPNGHGIVYIRGSAWHERLSYDARQRKGGVGMGVPLNVAALLDAGYTVFVINHRAAPRFRDPAAVEDAQRAVRFIRHHAERYGINSERIGGVGHSSGGHLVAMLGTLEGTGDASDPDPVSRESSKIQCVVASAAPADFLSWPPIWSREVLGSFLGMMRRPRGSRAYQTYWEASPTTHVSADDAPFLLVHGETDGSVPFQQAEVMQEALETAGVEVKLLRIRGGNHGLWPGNAEDTRNYRGEMIRWLNVHLIGEARADEYESLVAALGWLTKGENLAREGKVKDAMAAYSKAQELHPTLTVAAQYWNRLCGWGGKWGYASVVMSACEQAVALAPDNRYIRDSRGLARALTGDFDGAIADFEAFVAYIRSEEARAQRQGWIDALRAGRNPFTPEVLEKLRQ